MTSPPYGQQPQQYSQPPKKSALPWIISAIAVVLAGVGITLALVLSGGDGKRAGGGLTASDPVEVVKSLMAAAADGDADEALKYSCGELYDDIKSGGDNTGAPDGYSYVVDDKADISGDSATVKVDVEMDGEKATDLTATLERQDGVWKVCIVG